MDIKKNDTFNIKELTDDQVFSLSLKSPDLFAEIVTRYEKPFLHKAVGILRNEEDAYDAVQEAFVRIYSAATKYRLRKKASFRAWAYKILINQCFTMYQKKKKAMMLAVDAEEVVESVPDAYELASYERKLTKDYILSLVSKLPEILARTVTLYFINGLPQKKVAVLEGVSNEVIRTRIHRAKKQMRELSLHI